MDMVLKFLIDELKERFGSVATGIGKDALQLALKAAFDKFDGDPTWSTETRYTALGLVLDAVTAVSLGQGVDGGNHA